jgi:hypothetical protein
MDVPMKNGPNKRIADDRDSMRLEIERWLLIALLAVSYLSRAPGLVRQGWVGIPALVVGLVLAIIFIALLLRSSRKAALTIAILAGLGFVMTLLSQFVVGPHVFGVAHAPLLSIALAGAFSAVAAVCALDLWSAWSKQSSPK